MLICPFKVHRFISDKEDGNVGIEIAQLEYRGVECWAFRLPWRFLIRIICIHELRNLQMGNSCPTKTATAATLMLPFFHCWGARRCPASRSPSTWLSLSSSRHVNREAAHTTNPKPNLQKRPSTENVPTLLQNQNLPRMSLQHSGFILNLLCLPSAPERHECSSLPSAASINGL